MVSGIPIISNARSTSGAMPSRTSPEHPQRYICARAAPILPNSTACIPPDVAGNPAVFGVGGA